MWIPTRVYEALPTIYLSIGIALIGGTLYIGVNDWLMLGYSILGMVCISGGLVVSGLRQKARASQVYAEADTSGSSSKDSFGSNKLVAN